MYAPVHLEVELEPILLLLLRKQNPFKQTRSLAHPLSSPEDQNLQILAHQMHLVPLLTETRLQNPAIRLDLLDVPHSHVLNQKRVPAKHSQEFVAVAPNQLEIPTHRKSAPYYHSLLQVD